MCDAHLFHLALVLGSHNGAQIETFFLGSIPVVLSTFCLKIDLREDEEEDSDNSMNPLSRLSVDVDFSVFVWTCTDWGLELADSEDFLSLFLKDLK